MVNVKLGSEMGNVLFCIYIQGGKAPNSDLAGGGDEFQIQAEKGLIKH